MNQPNKSTFKNRDQEAKFWETNFDKTWSEGQPIKTKFAKNLTGSINLRLDPKSLIKVRSLAQQKGLGPTQLIRMWIMEKIGQSAVA